MQAFQFVEGTTVEWAAGDIEQIVQEGDLSICFRSQFFRSALIYFTELPILPPDYYFAKFLIMKFLSRNSIIPVKDHAPSGTNS
jgi:hypothetical protein